MKINGRVGVLMFVAIRGGVGESRRECKLKLPRNVDPTTCLLLSTQRLTYKSKYGSIELLADARGHWTRIRSARLPR